MAVGIKIRKKCVKIKKNGNRCKMNRIAGSKYCEHHGAFNPNSRRSRNRKVWSKITHGQSSKVLKAGPTISRLIQEVKRNKDYMDIDENIAIMILIMRKSIERAERDGGLDGVLDKSKDMFSMLEKVNRALHTKAKIEDGLKHKIDIEVVDIAIKQMMGILQKHIANPLVLRKIADDYSNIRVHDLPMKGHKPRQEHLRNLEQVNMDTRETMGDLVFNEMDEDDVEKTSVIFEMD